MAQKKKQSEKVDKRYRAKITIGHDLDGNAIVKYASGRTKKELMAAKEELRRSYINGGVAVQRDVLFGYYALTWFEAYKKPCLSVSSRKAYASVLNKHLLSVLGERQLRAITSAEIQALLNSKTGMKPSSIGYIHSILCSVFRKAYAEGIIDRDPTVGLVKPAAKKEVRRALTITEVAAALQVGNKHPEGLILLLLYYTGMRVGEVLGLQWQDIDFKRRTISVRRDVDFSTNEVGEVKTPTSIREIPMPDELALVLFPVRGIGNTFILQAPKTHSFIGQSTFTRRWERLMKAMAEVDPSIESKNGRSVLTAHYFRHNYASILYNAGIDVLSAQRFLGHADATTTLNIYTHLAAAKEAENAELARAAFHKQH